MMTPSHISGCVYSPNSDAVIKGKSEYLSPLSVPRINGHTTSARVDSGKTLGPVSISGVKSAWSLNTSIGRHSGAWREYQNMGRRGIETSVRLFQFWDWDRNDYHSWVKDSLKVAGLDINPRREVKTRKHAIIISYKYSTCTDFWSGQPGSTSNGQCTLVKHNRG